MVRGSNPGGARISARPDRPWGPPASCTMGTGSFPGVKYGRGVLLTTHSILVPWSWKSRSIPLPTIWATTGPVTGTVYLNYLLAAFLVRPVQTIAKSAFILSYPSIRRHVLVWFPLDGYLSNFLLQTFVKIL